MDQAQIRQLLEQKHQNPLLKRKPLNLGTKFLNLPKPGTELQLQNPLTAYPTLLLLFGAQWCNITKPFLSKLKSHYLQINLQSKNLEIIYISLDKSKKDFDQFTQSMPWLGISFEDGRVRDLKEFYNVRSIPCLLLLDDLGEVIENDCRADVYGLGEDQAYERWRGLKVVAREGGKGEGEGKEEKEGKVAV